MVPQWVIERKRDGHALEEGELRAFVAGYTRGEIPDYQMAALAMAIYFRGMTDDETAVLTDAMMRSGDLVDTSVLGRPTADKHSTGGIGDKVSLVLAPLVACCGVAVPMMSGRGLGITGGTLDKLETIPGYRTDLAIPAFLDILERVGCSIIGQTERLAPADRKLYALRDVTATVPSIPLITASIMSKKLAEGAGTLVLDVKVGSGAFMQDTAQARQLAASMVRIGRTMGRRMAALLTDMQEPLGRTAGNALEVRETIDALNGAGPRDLVDVTLALGEAMLVQAGAAPDAPAARRALEQALDSGAARERFGAMVDAHGGDRRILDDPARLPAAPIREPLPAPVDGYVRKADAGALGRACLVLGAGRRRADDTVDPAVGLSDLVKTGERVARGQPLAVLHARDPGTLAEARALAADAFAVAPDAPPPRRLIQETLP